MFRGRRTTTVYVYDDQGRVQRTVTASPWTDEDRALLLAYGKHKASRCPGCGEPKSLAWHPDNDGYYTVPDDLRVVCHGCTALAKVRAEGSSPSSEPVKPVEYLGVIHDRNYETHPLVEGSAR